MDRIPQERVVAAYQQAPAAVRDVFNSETTSGIIMDMRTRYRLHVDVAGALGQEVGYMLLGLRSPAEFFGNLMLAGTDEQTARGIMQEVNDRIFAPLQRQMANPEARASETTLPDPAPASEPAVPAPSPAPQPLAPMPAIDYEAPPAPSQILPGSPEPVPAIQPTPDPVIAVPSQQPTAPAPEPVPAWIPPAASVPPTSPPEEKPIQKEFGADPYREPI